MKDIAKKCSGCNFGSYPEMSLSARSFSTIRERLSLQRKAKKISIKPVSEEEIFKIIEEIKNKYPNYKGEREDFHFRKQKKWPKAPNIPSYLWQD